MLKKNSFLLLFTFITILLLAYQNCGVPKTNLTSSSNTTALSETSPQKLQSDFHTLAQSVSPNSCEFAPTDCSSLPTELERDSCSEDNLKSYYTGLRCLGFQIFSISNCLVAISNTSPQEAETVYFDAYCNTDGKSISRALHLSACSAQVVPFVDHPSTGIKLSAWLELPASELLVRTKAQAQYYSRLGNVNLSLSEITDSVSTQSFQDACGKTRSVHFNASSLSLQVQ